jgi:predicted phosphoadenosine phosphosulfate sulfurtransferase
VPKRYLSKNVLDAAHERIAEVFDNFQRIYVSFSAGKDSTVMLHLVAAEARKRGRRFGGLLIDLEGQYEVTIAHAQACLEMYRDVMDLDWVCLPISLRNAVSVYQPKWMCWDRSNAEAWIRQPPSQAITDHRHFPFFREGMEFEEFVPEYGEWYSQGQPTACFVGIRSDESLNRFRTVVSMRKQTFNGRLWTSQITPNVYNAYPIYDWHVEDIWTWHARNPGLPYNRLYDMMAKAGLTLSQMRICQPYGDDQRRGLWLFHLIEPETWARVVARVNGANGGALYVREWGNINGYRKITKPAQHTWRSFAQTLIRSMPPQMERRYRDKVLLFEKWWADRGYPQGIPDESDYQMEAQRLAPSWRRVCKSLLRNDYWCKGLGFSQHQSDAYDRYHAMMSKRRAKWNVDAQSLGLFPDGPPTAP